MRIAILGTRGIPSGYSGYETFAQQVGPRLVERGHDVTVYCRGALFPERVPEYRGVRLVYLPSIQTKSLSTFAHTFLSSVHLAFRRADVALFVNVSNAPFCLITKLARIRTALNVDGQEWLRPKWGTIARKYFLLCARMCKYTTNQIITDAPRMQEIYRERFRTESIDIAYGADIVEERDSSRVRDLSLEPGEYFFTVCRLVPDNNVHLLAEAYRRVRTDIPYVIAGDTPYPDAYVNDLKARADPRIRFLGQVEDQDLVDDLYANARAYLHGHEYGGTNPTLLRAMATGNCVAALDTTFNRGAIADAGFLFSNSPDEIAGVIQRIADEPDVAQQFHERAQQRIREEFSWDHITDRYEALCLRLSRR